MFVFTTNHDHALAALTCDNTPKTPIYGCSTRTLSVRRPQDQLPTTTLERAVLQEIYQHFAPNPHAFEGFAADIWLMSDPKVASIDVTRPSRDGGRDAVGEYLIGPHSDPIQIDFALEAKCYQRSSGVGVRDVSRLISRLRARQFGILVTTSYLNQQAYTEVREDKHPIIVISGKDIVEILSSVGHRTLAEVTAYLQSNHPVGAPTSVDLSFPEIEIALETEKL
ncbi:MAG: restriction endonuclease [Nakamurella sp.]